MINTRHSEDNWQGLRCCIVRAVEKSYGHGKQRQSKWDSVEKLVNISD